MIHDSLKSTSFIVRELMLKAEKQKVSLVIGIPAESQAEERRVPLTPETVSLLVSAGYRVLFEAGAGLSINYSDSYYARVGGRDSRNGAGGFSGRPDTEDITSHFWGGSDDATANHCFLVSLPA